MATRVFLYERDCGMKPGMEYRPVFAVISGRVYAVDSWYEFFKLALYRCCYKKNNLGALEKEIDVRRRIYGDVSLIARRRSDSEQWAKFSPELYFRVASDPCDNYAMLPHMMGFLSKDIPVYIIEYDAKEKDADSWSEESKKAIEEAGEEAKQRFQCERIVSARRALAQINRIILSEKEKFYKKVERGFDQHALIGDIEITEREEELLKSYMHMMIENIKSENQVIYHQKVFAYGLVRAALKHYNSKTFWPFFAQEYDVSLNANHQGKINAHFRRIMLRYGKLYDEAQESPVQNICMHAFICNHCADQLFNYIFGFWKEDLRRSIDNLQRDDDEESIDLFDVLIDEIKGNETVYVQGIMLHTTLALKLNTSGCKTRLRRILRMIDASYWNDADYSRSSNRVTQLFETWKHDPKGRFYEDWNRTASDRKRGRGAKLLSRPTIIFNPQEMCFSMRFPEEYLRSGNEEDMPFWVIRMVDDEYVIGPIEPEYRRPDDMSGRRLFNTVECETPLPEGYLFEKMEIELRSEEQRFTRTKVPAERVRFFSTNLRHVNTIYGYLPKDVRYAVVSKGDELIPLSGRLHKWPDSVAAFDVYEIEPAIGDVYLLPGGGALGVGEPLKEGLIGVGHVNSAMAEYAGKQYSIFNAPESIFFKATKDKYNGTSLRISKAEQQVYFGHVNTQQVREFRLDARVKDLYGYILDLSTWLQNDGVYEVEISVPGDQIKQYRICMLRGFTYAFADAPYLFKESGRICFPASMPLSINSDWEQNTDELSLEFSFDEAHGSENKYVKNRTLSLSYMMSDGTQLPIHFSLPTFYWRFGKQGEWMYETPEELFSKELPARVYVDGSIPTPVLHIDNTGYGEDWDLHPKYDKESELYYFQSSDIITDMDRKAPYRTVTVLSGGQRGDFLKVLSKSIVRSAVITGDFGRNLIYGALDIKGTSAYSVNISYESKLLAEDISVINGKFSAHCMTRDDFYDIEIFEVEEDESGFGEMSYSLDTLHLRLRDMHDLAGKTICLDHVHRRNSMTAELELSHRHEIYGLKLMNYTDEIEKPETPDEALDILTWLYDITDEEDRQKMEEFSYYRGTLVYQGEETSVVQGPALVVFDDTEDLGKALIYGVDISENVCTPLIYDPEKRVLAVKKNNMTKRARQMIRTLDDDLYEFSISVKE